MINDQTNPPEPALDEHLPALIALVNNLVALMSDPKGVQRRLADLAERTKAAQAASAQAATDREAADQRVADAQAEVDAAHERHGLERDKHHAAMAAREQDIVELERKAAAALAAAEADRIEAAKVKETLTRKLAAMQAA